MSNNCSFKDIMYESGQDSSDEPLDQDVCKVFLIIFPTFMYFTER